MPRTDPYHDELVDLWRDLGALGAGIIPAKLPVTPEPDDIAMIRVDLLLLARKADRLIAAYGEYLNAHVGYSVDQSLFKDQLYGALEGNALFEVEEAATDVREQMETMDPDAAYGAWRDSKMEDAR
jgi:hypothetical protein